MAIDRYSGGNVCQVAMTAVSQKMHSKGILLMLITTLIWGTSFPLLKYTLSDLSPATILVARFTIAAIAFSPFLRHLNPSLIRDGVLLGFIYFAECAAALIGLESISANRSAFLVSLNVLAVPLLSVFLGRNLPRRILFTAVVAIVGVGILSWEGGGFGPGDWLTFACAIGVAIYILTLEVIAPRHDTLPLVAMQLLTMAILGCLWALPQLTQIELMSNHSSVLLYLGLVVTATPIWTQALAQRWVPSHEAALIYTLEPVFATGFSFLLLGEKLGLRGAIGAGLILAATAMSQQQRS